MDKKRRHLSFDELVAMLVADGWEKVTNFNWPASGERANTERFTYQKDQDFLAIANLNGKAHIHSGPEKYDPYYEGDPLVPFGPA